MTDAWNDWGAEVVAPSTLRARERADLVEAER